MDTKNNNIPKKAVSVIKSKPTSNLMTKPITTHKSRNSIDTNNNANKSQKINKQQTTSKTLATNKTLTIDRTRVVSKTQTIEPVIKSEKKLSMRDGLVNDKNNDESDTNSDTKSDTKNETNSMLNSVDSSSIIASSDFFDSPFGLHRRPKSPKSSKSPESHESDNLDVDVNIDSFDFKKYADQIETPVSDDMMDYLDAENDKLNASKNLSEKIGLHNKLTNMIKRIGNEVDDMVAIIDKLDVESVTEELLQDATENDTEIEDDIVNMDKMLIGLKDEGILQIKIEYLKRLTDMVKNCRRKCDPTKMVISKCN